jgi:hypothetical protein
MDEDEVEVGWAGLLAPGLIEYLRTPPVLVLPTENGYLPLYLGNGEHYFFTSLVWMVRVFRAYPGLSEPGFRLSKNEVIVFI